MTDINLNIDGRDVTVPSGSTILEAAKKLGIEIPTLCHLDLHDTKMVNKTASCRICVVEVEGRDNLATACSTLATEGLVVNTRTIKVLHARKVVLELMMSDHPKDCLVCTKAGNCNLQDMSEKFGLRDIRFEGKESTYRKDISSSIVRDMDKCIMCRRCETMCNEVQTVGALSAINRGFDSVVSTAFDVDLEDSVCTHCGQCVAVCPTGALAEAEHTWEAVTELANPDKVVVVQTAPAVRAALGEMFGLEAGTLVTGKMVAALRELGFDYVFDTTFGADLTIMEESAELIDRLTRFLDGDKEVSLPMLTSCCPAWVNYFESQFPDLLDIPSSSKSPQQMFGAIAKSYFAEKIDVPREDMVVVSIMPCLAKKYEASREELGDDVDIVISTRELAGLIKQANIDFNNLEDEEFDLPLGESTGAGVIFGTTGGVIEAATRTAYEKLTDKTLEEVVFEDIRGFDGVRAATVKIDDFDLNIGIAHGLGNARELLEEIREGNPRDFHAIEIMACPGGCIGGGGQPYHGGDSGILKKRREALFTADDNKEIRKSHDNPSIIELYETYLDKPMSEKSHELLHTKYAPKDRV